MAMEMKIRTVVRVVARRVNVIHPLCNHVVGKHHTFTHRALAGVVVMTAGVVVAKTIGHNENEIVSLIGDGVGYGLHGFGLTPFIEAALAAEEV